jgi:4-amino-4-deoxy-L-arabinose transferase-like glycosyltransferase
MSQVWAIGLLIACLALEAGMRRVGIDDLDEGYFVQQAARVLNGQVPFRDFSTLYSPGLLYVHAAAFALFGGPSLLTVRALSLIARAALVLLLFVITRRFVRNPWWAAAPGLLMLLGFDDAPVRWEPHPGWLSTVFAVSAAWCLMHWPRSRWLLAAGAAAGLSYAFKQNTGAFVLLAIMAWCARRSWKPLTTFACVTLIWLLPFAVTVGDPRDLAPLVGGVNEASLFATPEPTVLIPVAALLAGLWYFRHYSDPRLRWLLLAGSALFLTEFPRMDTQHLAWSAPLLLVIGAIILDRQRPLVAAVALTVCAALLIPSLISRVTPFTQPLAPVDGVLAPDQTGTDIAGTVADIQQRTTPGEPIFVYPTSPLLYVLSDHPNPTRFDHLNPGAASASDIQGVIADLHTAHTRVVVVSEFWLTAWGPSGANAVLEDWLNAHFQEVARHGPYRVLVAGL